MQGSCGDCGFIVDIPTLPVARAIPCRWVLEPRAEHRGDNTKGCKQINQLHKEQSCLWQYLLCPGRLGLMMASATSNEEVLICQGIYHSHSLAAALWRPRPPPQLPVCPSASSEPARTWSCFCNWETKMFPARKSSPWPFFSFFLKEPLVFPLLEEARALCLAINRLPTSRCAQSIHPHSSKRKGLGREQAAWSPPTLFTQINEQSLNRNVFSSSAVEAVLWPVTHPLPTGLEENPGFMIKVSFPLCASPCGTTQLEQFGCFKLF